MIDPELTIDALQARVAGLVAGFGDDEPAVIDAQANLFELGLGSIALMQLVAGWRKAGLDVNFAELAERPTLNDWLQMLGERAANVHPAEINGDTGTGQEDGEFPLGLMQHAYWIGRGQGQRLSGVAAHLYAEFDGAGVEAPRLRRALDKLVARHDMLRARITDNGQQVIEPSPGRVGFTVHDLRELADGDVTARLSQLRDTMSHQVLDIEHGEVFAAALSLLPGGATRFHLDVDMVAADAVSYRILLSDLAVFYASPVAELPPVGYSYRRYLAARAELRGDARASAAQYWQRRLPSLPRAPALPMAVPHGAARPRATRRHCHLSAVQKAALEAAVRRRGVTPSMAIATLFAEVIGRWSADPRFLLNVPLFDRAPVHPNVGDVVGDFSSSLLLEVDLTEQVSFAERARAVQAQTHADAAHGDFSGVEVLRELTRRDTEQALATVVFTSALSLGELYSPMSREQFGDPVWMISQGPQVLLDAQITELSGGLLVNWDIRLDALADGVPEAMFAAFERLVRDLADDKLRWEEPIGDLVPAEQYAVRARRNGTVRPPSGRALHEGVFQLARRSPEAIALAGTGSGTLSYGELTQRALRVAGALAHRGIGRGHQVGISARGAEEQVVALLGVLAAGAVYVPVSTDGAEPLPYPDLDLALVLGASCPPGVELLAIGDAVTADPLPAPETAEPDDLAAVILLPESGSGHSRLEIRHGAGSAAVDHLTELINLHPGDQVLVLPELIAYRAVFDVFTVLSGGATLVTADAVPDGVAQWPRLVAEVSATVVSMAGAALGAFARAEAPLEGLGRRSRLDRVRAVVLAGEVMEPGAIARLSGRGVGRRRVQVVELGGMALPRTITDHSRDPAPIPLPHTPVRIVDRHGRDQPAWIPGTLLVAAPGGEWTPTTDTARYLPDGSCELLGMSASSGRVRGVHTHPAEVEAALVQDSRIRAAVAVLGEGSHDRYRLAAAVVGEDLDGGSVRERLRQRVPGHLIPDGLVVLPELPLTPAGEVDRVRVRELVEESAESVSRTGRVPPRTALESAIALVWAEILDLPDVGVTDQLFALGGDSVLATEIVARLRAALDTDAVSARMVFAAPTIAGLAGQMRQAEPPPRRLERVAEIYLEVAALSDDEVAVQLEDTAATS